MISARPLVGACALLFATPLSCFPGEPPGETELRAFIREGIADFHARRLERLEGLDLAAVLARKNPYLLKAKNLATPEEVVDSLLTEHLAIQESSLFGFFLEQLAVHVCAERFGGRKSAVEGIDLEFERDGVKYIVSIKSGPNWGNSSSIAKMEDHFRRAKRVLATNAAGAAKVVAVNGCCYGKVANEDRGDYLKLCGRNFWALISGDEEMFLRVMALIGDEGERQTEAFRVGYREVLARSSAEFRERYCRPDGSVRWAQLAEENSG